MEQGWDFLRTVVASAAVTSGLLAIALWLFKTQIAHWLNKDIEAIKAKHQQDLETYKVSLIAEAERAKAAQEVKKAMAVRIAEKKFQAIDRLHQAIDPETGSLLGFLAAADITPSEARMPQLAESLKAQKQLAWAIRMAAPFLLKDEVNLITRFSARLTDALAEATVDQMTQIKKEKLQDSATELMRAQIEVNRVISNHLHEMLEVFWSPTDNRRNEG